MDRKVFVQRPVENGSLLVCMRGGVDLPEAPIHGFSEFLHEWIV